MGVDFFSSSELLYPNVKISLRPIGATPNLYKVIDNPNVSLGTVDFSLYSRCFAPKDDYHKKPMGTHANTPVEYNSLETLAKTFIIPVRQNKLIQKKNIFNNAPARWIAIEMKTNSALTGSYTEIPFWHRQFDMRQFRLLKCVRPNVAFDANYFFGLYVTTRNSQDDILLISDEYSQEHYVLEFDLTLMKGATENCHYPNIVEEPPRLEQSFTFPPDNASELIVLGERMCSVAVDKLGIVEKLYKMENVYLQPKVNRIALLKFLYSGSFPPDYDPNLLQSWCYCHYENLTQQNAGWKLDNDSKLPSKIVFCRFSRSWNVEFPQALLQAYNARTTIVPSQCFATSTQYMQLFIYSSYTKKKLLEFTMLLDFHLYVASRNNLFCSIYLSRFYNV